MFMQLRILRPVVNRGRITGRLLLYFCSTLAIASPVVATAQDKSQGAEKAKDLDSVFTQPPTDDLSYELQGEFVGEVTVPVVAAPEEKKTETPDAETPDAENSVEKLADEARVATPAKVADESKVLGLQLRVVGGENFEGLSFVGGLPGEEAHQSKPMKLIGRRSGDFLVLSGGPWAIFVDKDGCSLVDKTGKTLGRLKRVERQSPTLGAKPPEHAIVLFDGTGTEQFQKGTMTEDGLLEEGADLKPMIQDFDLHIEFLLPYMPKKEGQGRANSGIYIMSRYECQILDSFAQEAVNNSCGAIYLFKSADVNMCLPPLVWQTYDVRFTAPRWAADQTKIRNAHITSWINGVKVQDDVDVPSSTGHGKPEEPTLLPTLLQNHNCPVRFRNAWIVDRGLLTSDRFPVKGTVESKLESTKPEKAGPEKANPENKSKKVEKAESTLSVQVENSEATAPAATTNEATK